MENKPSISRLRRVDALLTKKNKKYVTLDMLSKWVGVYSDVLSDDLVYFEPMVKMDPSLNMNDMHPSIKAYLNELDSKNKEERAYKPNRQVVRKKELAEYQSVADFIYKKMAGPGGLVSPSISLSDHDLHVLQTLVKAEVTKRRKKRK